LVLKADSEELHTCAIGPH